MTDDTTRRGRTTFTAALLVVLALALPVGAWGLTCGDGTVDVLEDCDEGPANGNPDSCCTVSCTFVPADTQCRDTTGECDPADVCSGTSGVCDDVKRTDVCRHCSITATKRRSGLHYCSPPSFSKKQIKVSMP